MCEEAGVPLDECTILPPALRGDPDASLAETAPGPQPLARPAPLAEPGPQPAAPRPAAFGTGTYGWCDDCTSFFGAAPITPWSTYGGRRFQPIRDEDDRAGISVADDTDPSGDPGDDDGNGDDGNGDDGNGDDGNGDDGNGDDGNGDDGNDDGGYHDRKC